MISQKLKSIIDEFAIVPHKYYSTNLKHNKTFYDNYYWMHIIQTDLRNYVNYKKSTFFIYNNYRTNIGDINISSFEDLLKKEEKLRGDNPGKTIAIWADVISLNKEFNKSLDGFKIGKFDSNFYISDNLRNAIHSNYITGCDISLANNIAICE